MSKEPLTRTYKVSIHKTGPYRYASTQPMVEDPVTHERKSQHIHWGRLDENNKFYPNQNYVDATPEERGRLVFPDDWDLSEIERLPVNQIKVVPGSVLTSHRLVAEKLRRQGGREAGASVAGEKLRTVIEKLEEEGLSGEKIVEIVKCML